ncbi:MAG TPA: hypothetical protein VJX23_12015 [Candidatus Binataceae bacterium]|nr:hypothetical protein [Candidatus Binataceae bacterium]
MDLNIHATADDLPSIFQGIGIMPAQYGNMCRKKLPAEGERKLLFAVLEDAIRCYLKNHDRGQTARNDPDFIEAAEWLSSDEESAPFSYIRVCEALGINPDRLRTGIDSHTGRLEEVRT